MLVRSLPVCEQDPTEVGYHGRVLRYFSKVPPFLFECSSRPSATTHHLPTCDVAVAVGVLSAGRLSPVCVGFVGVGPVVGGAVVGWFVVDV